MKETLVFASGNLHKINEVRSLLPAGTELKGLAEIGITDDIPETGDTLDANALIKARYVFERTGLTCFADDTGLEADALDGRPGVYSARYAGEQKDANANMDKLLAELQGKEDRRAQFRTVIAYVGEEGEHLFEGIVRGTILETKRGEKGFGYDPVFLPDGYEVSFAEMELAEKNRISHRGRAFEQLKKFLAENA